MEQWLCQNPDDNTSFTLNPDQPVTMAMSGHQTFLLEYSGKHSLTDAGDYSASPIFSEQQQEMERIKKLLGQKEWLLLKRTSRPESDGLMSIKVEKNRGVSGQDIKERKQALGELKQALKEFREGGIARRSYMEGVPLLLIPGSRLQLNPESAEYSGIAGITLGDTGNKKSGDSTTASTVKTKSGSGKKEKPTGKTGSSKPATGTGLTASAASTEPRFILTGGDNDDFTIVDRAPATPTSSKAENKSGQGKTTGKPEIASSSNITSAKKPSDLIEENVRSRLAKTNTHSPGLKGALAADTSTHSEAVTKSGMANSYSIKRPPPANRKDSDDRHHQSEIKPDVPDTKSTRSENKLNEVVTRNKSLMLYRNDNLLGKTKSDKPRRSRPENIPENEF